MTKRTIVYLFSYFFCIISLLLAYGFNTFAETEGDLIVNTTVIDGCSFDDHCYIIEKGGTYTFSMKEGVEKTKDVILINSNEAVKLILDSVNIDSDDFYKYKVANTYAGNADGTPAVWIYTNHQADVEIVFKGECHLAGANFWPAIMKFNNRAGGKLTVNSSGGENDSLTLNGVYGIGSHGDEPESSRNVTINGGRIIGKIGGDGVTNYVINDGYITSDSLGTVTINGGTVVLPKTNDSTITYNGGNLCCLNKATVVNSSGQELKMVVFPADEGLTGVEIDGKSSVCEAGDETNNQLYIFVTKEDHNVSLLYGDEKKDYTVTFIGDKPSVSGGVNAIYPNWALVSIKNAVISGIEEKVTFTGKHITQPNLKVTLDGNELITEQDYIVTYTDNKKTGKAGITVKGINVYKDTIYGHFEIVAIKNIMDEPPKPPSIKDATVTGIPESINSTDFPVKFDNLKLVVDGKELEYNKDYTVYYSFNPNYASGSYTIKGIYDYSGEINGRVNINHIYSNNNDSNNNNSNNSNSNNNNNTTEYVPPTPKPAGTTLPKSNYGSYYKVTSSSSSNPTATFTKPANKNTYSVYIDSTVYDDGVYYTVTTISDNAFKGCKSITYLSVPYSITKIGKNAFKDCKKLETFTIYTTKLNSKNVGKNAFKGITKKTTIRVPKSKKKAYTKLFRKKGLSKKVKIVGI